MLMQVTCPTGTKAGMKIPIQTSDGRDFEVEVPAGIKAGDIFHVEIPNAVATAIATPASLPVAHGVPVDSGSSSSHYPGATAHPPPSRPYQSEQPVNIHHVVVNDPYGHQYAREQYCGPISCIICLFVPCGFWIVLCPIDERLRRVA